MWYCLVGLGVVLVDQWSKAWVSRGLLPGQSIPVVPGFFSLTYAQNKGAAFGILQGWTPLFVVVAVGILLVAIAFRKKIAQEPIAARVGIALALGGAIGNLLDRIFRGWVVDFFDVSFFPPIFNVADAAIVAGAVLLFFTMSAGAKGAGAVSDEA